MAGIVVCGCPGTAWPRDARNPGPAIVWDRDDTLNHDPGYIRSWSQFRWRPRAIEALAEAERLGFRNLVATNQSGITKGFLTEDDLLELSHKMMAEAPISAIAYCVHESGQGCPARKPMPGMLDALDAVVGIERSRSVMVGDRPTDVECGVAAGLRACLCLPDESVVQALERALKELESA